MASCQPHNCKLVYKHTHMAAFFTTGSWKQKSPHGPHGHPGRCECWGGEDIGGAWCLWHPKKMDWALVLLLTTYSLPPWPYPHRTATGQEPVLLRDIWALGLFQPLALYAALGQNDWRFCALSSYSVHRALTSGLRSCRGQGLPRWWVTDSGFHCSSNWVSLVSPTRLSTPTQKDWVRREMVLETFKQPNFHLLCVAGWWGAFYLAGEEHLDEA